MADTLIELAELVEKATGPDRELDARIWCAVNGKEWPAPPYKKMMPDYDDDPTGETLVMGITGAGLIRQCYIDQSLRYTASIDAAMTLLSEGSEYDLTNLYGVARAHVDMANEYGGHHGSNECGSMPLALCAAALRARAAMDSAA